MNPAEAVSRNVVVTNQGGEWFVIDFDFLCACGQIHNGHEICQRPIHFVGIVRDCGSTKVVFDYTGARFVDAVGVPN